MEMVPVKCRRVSSWLRHLFSLAGLSIILFCLGTMLVVVQMLNSLETSKTKKLAEETKLPGRYHVQIPTIYGLVKTTNKKSKMLPADDRIAVLVIAANRPEAIANHLAQIKKLRKHPTKFPIVISQDGDVEAVRKAIAVFINSSANTFHIQRKNKPQLPSSISKSVKNYFYISEHYKWSMDNVFNQMKFKTVVITEDDLDLSDDFFSYFSATQYLLYEDPSIWCVSAWNDNGAVFLTDRHKGEHLYRTDFFPGLGWMLTSQLWAELSPDWPTVYWDDWMRETNVRKNRVCVRPEISRTLHNMLVAGKGSSNGLFKNYLMSIRLPNEAVDFSLLDMDRLKKENYDAQFGRLVLDAKQISIDELLAKESKVNLSAEFSYRVVYKDPREYRRIANRFKLMTDFRMGVPRTAYYGVVTFMYNGIRFYLVHVNLRLEDEAFGAVNSSQVYDVEWESMSRYLDFAEVYCKPNRWKGKCDPKDKGMLDWLDKKNLRKKLESWGELKVF